MVLRFSVQMSPQVENESKVSSLVDSPRSSATPEDAAEEVASAEAASDDANDAYFVPMTEMGGDKESPANGAETTRKRSYGGGFAAKKKKHDSLQEGWSHASSFRGRLPSENIYFKCYNANCSVVLSNC